MRDRMTRYPLHSCGWWHNPETTPCPSPAEMFAMGRRDYEEEWAEAERQGMTREQFDAGWERRAYHS